ncbi:MAG: type II secretion system protein [Planctomycetota bacterium]
MCKLISNSSNRKGFTLVELLVVIAILSVLMGLVFPALMRGKGTANKTACASNLRQIVTLARMYAEEEKTFPFAGEGACAVEHIQTLIDFYPKDIKPKLFVCPGSTEKESKIEPGGTYRDVIINENNISYAWLMEESNPDSGANRILVADKSLANHNDEGINVAYFGTDVEFLKAKEGITWEMLTENQLTK